MLFSNSCASNHAKSPANERKNSLQGRATIIKLFVSNARRLIDARFLRALAAIVPSSLLCEQRPGSYLVDRTFIASNPDPRASNMTPPTWNARLLDSRQVYIGICSKSEARYNLRFTVASNQTTTSLQCLRFRGGEMKEVL